MKKTTSIIFLLLMTMGILSLACSGDIQDEAENSPTTSFHDIPNIPGPYMRIYPVFGSVGSTSTMPVYLGGVTNGVSGFMLELEAANPEMVAIAGIRYKIDGLWSIDKANDGSGAMVNTAMAMADVHHLIGEDTRLVFEVDVLHLQPGVTHIVLNGVLRVDDEDGNEVGVRFIAGEVSSR